MLVFIDIETTGLNPDVDHILEVAAVATDDGLRVHDVFPGVVIDPGEVALSYMDDFVRDMHTKNSLLSDIELMGMGLREAEERLLAWLQRQGSARAVPMAGSSIHFDRSFLAKHMPNVEAWFHYRSVDVSSVKELSARWTPEIGTGPEPQKLHRAINDVHDTINELRHYRKHIFRKASK